MQTHIYTLLSYTHICSFLNKFLVSLESVSFSVVDSQPRCDTLDFHCYTERTEKKCSDSIVCRVRCGEWRGKQGGVVEQEAIVKVLSLCESHMKSLS